MVTAWRSPQTKSFPSTDITDGGDGIDTASFSDIGVDVTADLSTGEAIYSPSDSVVVIDSLISIENLTGSLNNDLLIGDANANVLKGNAGNDTLTGGDGQDVFIFGIGFGADTIADFEAGDTLDFSLYTDDVNQILGAAIQDDSNTVIDLGSDSLTLENFAVGDLTFDNVI